jgi:acylphosphatase
MEANCRHGFACAKITLMTDKARVHILLSGRVQGVAYRYFAEKYAHSLGVTGWVRNRGDGRVEILAEGDRVSVDRFLGHLKEGPRLARVDDVDIRWEEFTGEFPDFRVSFSYD